MKRGFLLLPIMWWEDLVHHLLPQVAAWCAMDISSDRALSPSQGQPFHLWPVWMIETHMSL